MRINTSELLVTAPSGGVRGNVVRVCGPCEIIRAGSAWVAPGFTQASNEIWPEMFSPEGLFKLAHCFNPSNGSAALSVSKPGYAGDKGPDPVLAVRTKFPSAAAPTVPLFLIG